MLSRKQFFKNLLFRGIRALNDLSIADEPRPGENEELRRGIDLPATELSPSLLAVEAEVRGVFLQAGHTEELQRKIYQELARSCPHAEKGERQ